MLVRNTRACCWWAVGLLASLAAAMAAGCGRPHERAPAVVPLTASPLTTAGDRFDVVIPRNTPVTITAVNGNPDDEWYRAIRYDWAAGGRAQSGRRTAAEGPLRLPAAEGRGFLYVDAVHREPGTAPAAAEHKSRLRGKLFKSRRLGDNIWRLSFRDHADTGPRDDLEVTVHFGRRQSPTAAVATGPAPPAASRAATGDRAAAAVPARPTWGAKELGRPSEANPCAVCRTSERLIFHVTDARNAYWIRCGRCNRSGMSKPTPVEGEASWNEENPPVATTTQPES